MFFIQFFVPGTRHQGSGIRHQTPPVMQLQTTNDAPVREHFQGKADIHTLLYGEEGVMLKK